MSHSPRVNGMRPRVSPHTYDPDYPHVFVAYGELREEFLTLLPASYLAALYSHECYGDCDSGQPLLAILEVDHRRRQTGRVYPTLICRECGYTEHWDRASGIAAPRGRRVPA